MHDVSKFSYAFMNYGILHEINICSVGGDFMATIAFTGSNNDGQNSITIILINKVTDDSPKSYIPQDQHAINSSLFLHNRGL